MPLQERKRKRKPDKSNVRSLHMDPAANQAALAEAYSKNSNNPNTQSTGSDTEDNPPDDYTQEDLARIKDILNQSNSRQNFAWKLCQFFFDVSELEGCNCYGRKGKKPLDIRRLKKIQALAFLYFPLTTIEDYPKAWSNCRIAIDKGIRNIFYDVGAVKKFQASTTLS